MLRGFVKEPPLRHASIALLLAAASAAAQERPSGLREAAPGWHALTGARIVVRPGQVIERGTLIVRDGRVVAVGAQLPVPAGAREWKLDGATVLPGFIDLASPLGVPAALREPPAAAPDPFAEPGPRVNPPPTGAPLAGRSLAARNPMLRAEQQVAAQLELRPDTQAALAQARRLGFGAVLAAPSYGVLRGQGALLALRDESDPKALVLAAAPSQHLGWDAMPAGQAPSSLMGAIALTRQALLDARWQAARPGERAPNATLDALAPLLAGRQLAVAQARDEQDLARWAALQRDEARLPRLLLQGNGFEYRQLARLREAGLPLLLPLNFPEPPLLSGDAARQLPLQQLQHWEAAPSNPAWLQQAGLRFAFTAAGVAPAQFWPRLRQTLRRGLPVDAALAALTTEPAALLGETQRLGTLEPGRLALLSVHSADPFTQEQAEPLFSMVGEQVHEHAAWRQPDARGRWQLADGRELRVQGSRERPQARLGDTACQLQQLDALWQLDCGDSLRGAATQQGGALFGQLALADGTQRPWSAQRLAGPAEASPEARPEPRPPLPEDRYPFGAYALSTPPATPVLLQGATLWTQGPQGVLQGADLLLAGGRIAAVGRGLAAPEGVQRIDARGLHVTPGLIDAHSHIAISRGINEVSDAVTAEVRVADVLDATDINLYRQLAGGVTTANLLHGSANLIGGQSAVIKLRWGRPAAELLFREAPASIKFALGENPKQANFGSSTRYPQTRLGIEQLLIDSFQQAADYAAQMNTQKNAQKDARRDLRLEALAELLDGRRQIHIHSYRADEMRLFVRLAKEWKLKVAAFQHGLEGYKLAADIASIGAGLSTFSDWWGFKAEAEDAVVGNAALASRAGVVTSLNSDDAELARRLNTEAAKAVRVGGGAGGLSESEALALVTLNPARQLGVAHLVGSLEAGKQADVVLWSGPPLSASSRALSTWVDGRLLFDRRRDAELRERDALERERLLASLRRSVPAAAAQAPAQASPALQLLLEQARAYRHAQHAGHGDYNDGQATHECTQ